MSVDRELAERIADEALELSKEIQPLLHGQGSGKQGAVLADLLAIWLAGHPAEIREELLAAHIKHVRLLIPPSEAQIREKSQ